jgi:excisionase family DNA binding protein
VRELVLPPRLERPPVRSVDDLNGLASVIWERLEQRPIWALGDWLTDEQVAELSTLRHVTLGLVEWALDYAQEQAHAGHGRSAARIVLELVRQPLLERLRQPAPVDPEPVEQQAAPPAPPTDNAWRMADAVAFLGLSERTIRNLVSARKIPHYRVGRALRFIPESLRAWQAKRETPDRTR